MIAFRNNTSLKEFIGPHKITGNQKFLTPSPNAATGHCRPCRSLCCHKLWQPLRLEPLKKDRLSTIFLN